MIPQPCGIPREPNYQSKQPSCLETTISMDSHASISIIEPAMPSQSTTLNPAYGEENPLPDIFRDQKDSSDPIAGFVQNKLLIIESAIKQVMGEISQREILLAELLEDIEQQICIQKEMFFRVAPYGASFITEGDPKRRVAIERTLAELECEKRREQASAWKDIASLKRELRELFREYNEEKRKQRVMLP